MTADKHWRDETLDPEVRSMLESAAALDEPSQKSLDGLRSKVASLFLVPPPPAGGHGESGGSPPSGPAAPAAGGGTGTAAGTTTASLGIKTVVTVATLIGGAVAVRTATHQKPPPPPQLAAPTRFEPQPPAPPPPALEAPTPAEPPLAPLPPPPTKASGIKRLTPVKMEPPPKPPSGPVDEELALLQDAMSAPTPALALAATERHVVKYPQSPMAQEREAIAIEALVKLGQVDAARARAEEFRNHWPTSTHLVRLEALLGRQ
jgi:hypothetical protein